MTYRILISLVVGGIAAATGCASYNHITVQSNGKLLVATGGTWQSGKILECTREGDVLDCTELAFKAPEPVLEPVASAEPSSIIIDRNKLDFAARKLVLWKGKTVVVTISDGTLMSGMLTDVRGVAPETMLVLQTGEGPKAVYLRDVIRVTAANSAR